MKIWKIAMITTLVVALVLGIALPGLADSGETATATDTDEAWGKRFPRIIRGEVIDIGDRLFVVQAGERKVRIHVTDETKFFIVTKPMIAQHQWQLYPELENAQPPMPTILKSRANIFQLRKGKAGEEPTLFMPQDNGQGMVQGIWDRLPWPPHSGEKATFDDLRIGDKVVVLLTPPENDTLTAEVEKEFTAQVVLIVRPSVWNRVAGTIKRLSDDAIVIEPVSGGDVVSLRYDENTTFILKGFTSVETEQFAHAVYNTETMVARTVRVWTEAPPIPLLAE